MGEYINDFTVLIDCSPEVMLLAIYLYEDLFYVECIAVASVFSFQSSSVYSSEFDTPKSDSFSTDGDASFGEEIFDIAVA
jgi:hypothetical protein